ncbi:MAG: hypothetical protein HC903_02125 [Methylacidiphilales bacterium]|nr:hypothetical protein [Candidatus Methylacidiphilales bacterium]
MRVAVKVLIWEWGMANWAWRRVKKAMPIAHSAIFNIFLAKMKVIGSSLGILKPEVSATQLSDI